MADQHKYLPEGKTYDEGNYANQPRTAAFLDIAETEFWQAFNDLCGQITAKMTKNGSTGRPVVTRHAVEPLFELLDAWRPGITRNQWEKLVKEEKERSGGSESRNVQDAIRDAVVGRIQSAARRARLSGGSNESAD